MDSLGSVVDDRVVTVTLVTSSILALVVNLLLVIVFCRRRGLRTVSNRFVINLLLTNLLSSVLLIPFLVVDHELGAADGGASNTNFSSVTVETVEDVASDDAEDVVFALEEDLTVDIVTVNITASAGLEKMLCFVAEGGTGAVFAASILSILLIAVDQYFAVIHSLRYHACIDKWTSVVMIASSWLVAVVFGALGAGARAHSKLWRLCRWRGDPEPADASFRIFATGYAFAYALLVILAPFALISLIYVSIFRAARRSSERMRRSTSGNSNTNLECYAPVPQLADCLSFRIDLAEGGGGGKLPKASSAPNFGALADPAMRAAAPPPASSVVVRTQEHARAAPPNATAGFINSLRYKLSNASSVVFKYREETRAAKISVLVVVLVMVCYLPYGAALVLGTDAVGVRTPRLFDRLALLLLVLSNLVSPFLFAYRNRRVRRELWRLLGFKPPSAGRHSHAVRNRNLSLRRNTATVLSPLDSSADAEAAATEALEPLNAEGGACAIVPEIVTETETCKKSILKRVCSKSKTWTNKKCNFIAVPESCFGAADSRGSFSSASTQVSSEE